MPKMSSLKKAMLSIDLFGKPFNFRVHESFIKHKTKTGFFFTILMILIMIGYSAHKWTVMTSYDDTSILDTVHHNHFDDNFEIKSETHNFKVAFAFVNYDDPTEMARAGIAEEDYGEIKAFTKTWGDPNNPGTHFTELASRPCRKDELLLDNGEASSEHGHSEGHEIETHQENF